MWTEAKEAWLSKRGRFVLCIWGSALTSITLWAYLRKPYEKQIEKEIIIDLPKSTFNLKQNINTDTKEEDDQDSASKSQFIDPSSVSKLHKEQLWRYFNYFTPFLTHRIFLKFFVSFHKTQFMAD